MEKHRIVVVGGGPAGMAAAVAAYDMGVRDVVILDREEAPGGILRQCIHNGFGLHKLGEELTGPEYAAVYEKMVRERNIPILTQSTVLQITPEKEVTVTSPKGLVKYQADAVILAMGCRERSRGALNISGTRPAGIYSAGTAQKLMNCDGYLVGKRAVILGSGDIGLIMARRMTLQGAKVEAVCELLPYSGGLIRNIVQCLEDYSIPLYLSTTVTEIHGKERLEGVTVSQVDENRKPIPGTERYISCDTLLLSCGLIPENELTRSAGIEMDRITGGPVVDQNRQTNTEGIFACGNVLQVHDLVDYVSDEAEIAGQAAARYVMNSCTAEASLNVMPGSGIRYTVPQRIEKNGEDVAVYFRVKNPVGKVRFRALSGDVELSTATRLRAAPGEMEKLILKGEKLQNATDDIVLLAEEL